MTATPLHLLPCGRRPTVLRLAHGSHPTDPQVELVRIRSIGREVSVQALPFDDDDFWWSQLHLVSSA